MSAEELAGLVCEALLKAGTTTTLSGGGCVAIWSEGQYVSRDLDFIEEGPVPRRKVKAVLAELGFVEKHRYFVHPDSLALDEDPKPSLCNPMAFPYAFLRTSLLPSRSIA
jgi:hypothetical protein